MFAQVQMRKCTNAKIYSDLSNLPSACQCEISFYKFKINLELCAQTQQNLLLHSHSYPETVKETLWNWCWQKNGNVRVQSKRRNFSVRSQRFVEIEAKKKNGVTKKMKSVEWQHVIAAVRGFQLWVLNHGRGEGVFPPQSLCQKAHCSAEAGRAQVSLEAAQGHQMFVPLLSAWHR